MSIILSGLHLTHASRRDSRQTINRNNNDVFTASKSWCVCVCKKVVTTSFHPLQEGVNSNQRSSINPGRSLLCAFLRRSKYYSTRVVLFWNTKKSPTFSKPSKVKNCNPLHAIHAVLGIIRSKLWTSLLLYDLQQHHYCQGPSIPLYSSMLYYVLYQGGLKGGPRQPRPPIFGGKWNRACF